MIEDLEEATTPPAEPLKEAKEEYQTHLTYFTTKDGNGAVYMKAVMEPTMESVGDMARIIANIFNIKIHSQTIQVIRENLIKSEQPELLKHFEIQVITAAMKKPINTETGEEEPCVSPSDIMT